MNPNGTFRCLGVLCEEDEIGSRPLLLKLKKKTSISHPNFSPGTTLNVKVDFNGLAILTFLEIKTSFIGYIFSTGKCMSNLGRVVKRVCCRCYEVGKG